MSPTQLKAVQDYLEKQTGEIDLMDFTRAANISYSCARRERTKYQKGRPAAPQVTQQVVPGLPEVGHRLADDGCEMVSHNPCTLEDLLRVCKVDTTVWRVARFVQNKWEVGSRGEDGTVIRTPLFQVKAFLERIPGLDMVQALREICDEIRANSPVGETPPELERGIRVDDPHMLEVSLPDIHVGKLTWAPEVGVNYDLRIAPPTAMRAARELWARASVFPIRRILLPIGNDFFNSNNAEGTTAGGTSQDNDGRWKKSFKVGIKLAVDLIEFFRGKAEDGIDVVIVPGNHDPALTFFLGSVLEGIYSTTSDVRVDNSESDRKYFRFGATLLGFTHGHKEKHDRLPLLMAGERPTDWAQTQHHEFHLGHLHHARETRYHAGQEFGPVRVRILPSLCPADEWHYTSGYVGARRSVEAYLWSFKHGYSGHLAYVVPSADKS